MTPSDRHLLEAALDQLAIALGEANACTPKLTVLYEKAVSVVRDRPPGVRRLRSDYQEKRVGSQQPLIGI